MEEELLFQAATSAAGDWDESVIAAVADYLSELTASSFVAEIVEIYI